MRMLIITKITHLQDKIIEHWRWISNGEKKIERQHSKILEIHNLIAKRLHDLTYAYCSDSPIDQVNEYKMTKKRSYSTLASLDSLRITHIHKHRRQIRVQKGQIHQDRAYHTWIFFLKKTKLCLLFDLWQTLFNN